MKNYTTKIWLAKQKNGYTILELLFYISLFTVLVIVVINSLITMTKAFKETATLRGQVQGGAVMERISREIKFASSIVSISASDLKLNTIDSVGAAKTIEFLLSGSDIQLLENNVFTGNLNNPHLSVGGLSFTQITTVKGTAVKILLTTTSTDDPLGRAENFYDTLVLRGDY